MASKVPVQKRSRSFFFFFQITTTPHGDVTDTVKEERIESEQKETPPLAGEERVKPITEDQSGLGEHCKPPQ